MPNNTTLNGSYPSGYALTSPGYTLTNLGSIGGGGLQVTGGGNTVINEGQIGGHGVYFVAAPGMALTNATGATISAASLGVDFSGTATVVNAGSIAGGNSYGNYGIFLRAAGLLTNEAGGIISGYYAVGTGFGYPTGTMFAYYSPPLTVVNDGTILGSTTHTSFESGAGILVSAGGTVVNNSDGLITGAEAIENRGTPGLTVINAGSIVGESADYHGYGVVLRGAGGAVTNQAGGFISGYFGVDIYGTSGNGTVVNSGTIVGNTTTFGIGIRLSGGSVTNNGTIAGGAGIDISTNRGTVTNYGLIDGSTETVGSGARLNVGGAFTNAASGIVTGAANGVLIQGGAGSLINAGHIAANATSGTGVYIELGGAVTNQAGGTITGNIGVDILHYNGGGTLLNAGSIGGTTAAVRFDSNANDRLIVDPGARFSGIVDGGNAIGPFPLYVSTLELASGGTGTLAGLGSQYINFDQVTLDVGASWLLSGANTLVSGATISGSGEATIAPAATLNAQGNVALGTTIAFGGNGGVLQVSKILGQFAGTVADMAQGDTIVVTGVTNATAANVIAGNTLQVTRSVGTPIDLLLDPGQDFSGVSFGVATVGGNTNVTELACFATGTLILTEHGDVPVEALRAGDLVRTLLADAMQPLTWVGHRRVNCRRHPRPQQVWPVRIAAGAFGKCQPGRDLFLSPDHAVYSDGVLIPVRFLINGSTIAQVPVDEVTYWHLELARHDVLLAEGMPAESYLDINHRLSFANSRGPVELHPDFVAHRWEAQGCAPLVLTGPALASVRDRLAARAAIAEAA
jgi:Hint domain